MVGSITHCRGFAAAAVARQDEVAAVGIDAEVHGPLSVGTAGKVCTPAELAWATEAPGAGLVSWPTVLFSARESVYKAWHPITGAWLGFLDVDITVDVEGGAFTARLGEWVQAPPGSGAPRTFTGRFLVTNDHVLTTVVVALGGDPP